jgi:CubicO group peptidase (beta-lactamase class C family)
LVFIFHCTKKDEAADILRIDNQPFSWKYSTPEAQGMSGIKLSALIESLNEKGTKKLMIIKNDHIVVDWSEIGWADSVRGHYTASLAKAIVSGMSLAAAMDDGLLHLDEAACNHILQWKSKELQSKITIRHLATHTSGLEDAEVSEEMKQEMTEKGLHTHMDLPGWKGQFWRKSPDPFTVSRDAAPVVFLPGTGYAYSNPGISMLNYVVTSSLKDTQQQDIRSYLQERIYRPIGINDNEYSIGYGTSYKVSGLNLVAGWGGGEFTARAVARIGRLMKNYGNWQGVQILDSAVVYQVISYTGTPISKARTLRPNIYSYNPVPATTAGWYTNFDGIWKYLPRDAFAGAGAQNQLLLVIPSLDLIVVRFGESLFDEGKGENFWYGAEKYLFEPLIEAIQAAPYTTSALIKEIRWSPENEVIRLAHGGDNWPVTWADDDFLYTSYGDGYGFLPYTEIKLSLGFSRVSGYPPDINGTNIRSASGERVGQGKYGPKASGMLMVDGMLFMLVRNVDNSSLAWSEDHGLTWHWVDWKFTESFGCPTFLNYGRNYENARDDYIYIYSHDENSAYMISDHMVLARVLKNNVKNWVDYEYYAGTKDGKPVWTEDIRKRKPVFTNPGKCYRSGVTYNEGLERYLWCQVLPTPSTDRVGTRFSGGLAIYEAPEPWGPWSTVYYTLNWDMGPGETSSIPTKWMSKDGQTCYYLFSGEDAFSVRKLQLMIQGE